MTTIDTLRIGKFTVEFETACGWIKSYTNADANRTSSDPYAYPAYDGYQSDTNDPGTLTDSDLLAPVLLNVDISIRSYYALQGVREALEVALSDGELAKDLADLSPNKITEATSSIYKVLDTVPRPSGIKATTLSKIVHRKRPRSLALHDKWVKGCYVGADAAVPLARTGERTWAEYMSLVTLAIAENLRSQHDAFAQLQAHSLATTPALTDLRLLDILAWNLGQHAGDFKPA